VGMAPAQHGAGAESHTTRGSGARPWAGPGTRVCVIAFSHYKKKKKWGVPWWRRLRVLSDSVFGSVIYVFLCVFWMQECVCEALRAFVFHQDVKGDLSSQEFLFSEQKSVSCISASNSLSNGGRSLYRTAFRCKVWRDCLLFLLRCEFSVRLVIWR